MTLLLAVFLSPDDKTNLLIMLFSVLLCAVVLSVGLSTYLDYKVHISIYHYAHSNFKGAAEWNLTSEEVLDLKELFMIFDSDRDGVLTFIQVKNAINVLGKHIEGKNHIY